MELALIAVFALALNTDCLLTGVAYGMRRIRLPLRSLLVVSAVSGAVLAAAMYAGGRLGALIPANFINFLASMVLAFIGFCRIIAVIRNTVRSKAAENALITAFRVPFLCIAVQILRAPEKADFNADGTVDSRDALMLGVALSLDLAAGGLAAALAGFPLGLTCSVTVLMCFALLLAALRIGGAVGERLSAVWGKRVEYLPGIMLIALAVWRIF